jgi:hypothetical protein
MSDKCDFQRRYLVPGCDSLSTAQDQAAGRLGLSGKSILGQGKKDRNERGVLSDHAHVITIRKRPVIEALACCAAIDDPLGLDLWKNGFVGLPLRDEEQRGNECLVVSLAQSAG